MSVDHHSLSIAIASALYDPAPAIGHTAQFRIGMWVELGIVL